MVVGLRAAEKKTAAWEKKNSYMFRVVYDFVRPLSRVNSSVMVSTIPQIVLCVSFNLNIAADFRPNDDLFRNILSVSNKTSRLFHIWRHSEKVGSRIKKHVDLRPSTLQAVTWDFCRRINRRCAEFKVGNVFAPVLKRYLQHVFLLSSAASCSIEPDFKEMKQSWKSSSQRAA